MVKPWTHLASTEVADHGFFRVSRDRARSPRTGAELDFTVVHMVDWLQVIPVTTDGRLVLVRQYRHGSRRVGLEFPGGLYEPDDANPGSGAMRECLEETGYAGGELRPLGTLSPQSALFSNRVHVFLAEPVTRRAAITQDAGEDLEVVLAAPSELARLVETGEIENTLTLAVLALARLRDALAPLDPDRG
ncbi:MAG TPA: NUDIX hydrolase [Gammaproteobacteria bacterium]